MQLKAVIFDLDGVLVHTSRFHGQAWADLVRGLGLQPPADLEERVKGISRMASLRIALGENVKNYTEAQLDELAAKKNLRYLELVKHIGPSDLLGGVRDLFDDLKRSGIKIVLGSASKNAKPILKGLGILDYFDAIADGFAFVHSKPHPDVFLAAARMVGLSAGECIVVEDAAAGITAALDGGFVAVGMGNWDSLKHAHLFVKDLSQLDASVLRDLHSRFCVDRWTVTRQGAHDAKRESSLHTVFCVGNGRLGIRGRLPQLPVGEGQGIYLAGFYDKVTRPDQKPDTWGSFMRYWGVADLARGLQIETCIVNCPNFLDMDFHLGSERIDFTKGQLLDLVRRLDMRSGLFTAEAHWVSPEGKEIRITQRRLADLVNTHLVWEEYVLEPVNFSGPLDIRAGIDTALPTWEDQRIYDVTKSVACGAQAVAVLVEGKADKMIAAFASGLKVLDRPHLEYRLATGEKPAVSATVDLAKGQLLCIHRLAAVADGRRERSPLAAAEAALEQALVRSFETARIESTAAWQRYWNDSDVRIEGSDEDQVAARFSIYNLLIAASRDDSGVSIPAKALSGNGYRGMVFWDTDIYMAPFFNFTQPALGANLARFRYQTLDGARSKARKYGFKGACYPWETGYCGLEETEKWLKLITHQAHVTADVCYAVQQYLDCTGDREFYEECAAELFIETARFWLSKAVEKGDEISIPDAGGPDESHVVCDDSAIVCHLAAWNIRLADQAVTHLRRNAPAKLDDIRHRTGLSDEEIEKFASWPARIRTMQRPDGLFEQCRGFFSLKDKVEQNIWTTDVHLTQTVKQADVLLLFYLFPGRWLADVVRKNWDYYEPRTVHGSSLSHAVHGILAAEMGLAGKAQDYMRRSMGMDLHDEMGNTAGGAHMAANGMNWVALVRGYGGAWPAGDRFVIWPRLPQGWTRLAFGLKWRGADFTVDITAAGVTVANKPSAREALPLTLCGRPCTLEPGQSITA